MLKIALVANTYPQARQFLQYKFKDSIEMFNLSQGTCRLKNGDVISLCYDEKSVSSGRYLSEIFDAIIVHPEYESLLDVIRRRASRL